MNTERRVRKNALILLLKCIKTLDTLIFHCVHQLCLVAVKLNRHWRKKTVHAIVVTGLYCVDSSLEGLECERSKMRHNEIEKMHRKS